MNQGRLKGKVAVITGGASGIGRATAERFVQEGARVWVLDQDPGTDLPSVQVDVTDESGIENAFSQVIAAEGQVDVCLANAGISLEVARVINLKTETWRRTLDVNLTGVFLTVRAAARVMVATGRGGRILVTSSVSGVIGEAGGAAYCASKFGVRGLVEALALELGPAGITVNAVAPGNVDTPLNAGVVAKIEGPESGSSGGRDYVSSRVPVRRIADPSEIAGLFAYLASEEAAYLTGETIVIDGGLRLVGHSSQS